MAIKLHGPGLKAFSISSSTQLGNTMISMSTKHWLRLDLFFCPYGCNRLKRSGAGYPMISTTESRISGLGGVNFEVFNMSVFIDLMKFDELI